MKAYDFFSAQPKGIVLNWRKWQKTEHGKVWKLWILTVDCLWHRLYAIGSSSRSQSRSRSRCSSALVLADRRAYRRLNSAQIEEDSLCKELHIIGEISVLTYVSTPHVPQLSLALYIWVNAKHSMNCGLFVRLIVSLSPP